MVGLVFAGWIGMASERMRRRKPFIAVLGVCGVLGLTLLAWSVPLAGVLESFQEKVYPSLSAKREGDNNWIVLTLAFLGYLLADVSHDLLLIPGRSLCADLATSYSRRHGLRNDAEVSNTVFTLFQMVGRTLLLALGAVDSTAILPSSGCDARACAHMQALIQVCILVLILCCLSCICMVESERVLREEFVEIDIAVGEPPESDSSFKTGRLYSEPPNSLLMPEEKSELEGTSAFGAYKRLLWSNYVLVLLIGSQIYGWIGIMCISFYWTLWLGQGAAAFMGLSAAALVGLFSAIVLNFLNSRIGVGTNYFIGEISFSVCLMLTRWANQDWQTVTLSAITGFMYATHQTNPYVIAELSIPKEELLKNRGLIVAAIQSSMPIAQVLVGAFSGLVIDALDNRPELLFFYVGVTGIVVQAALALKYLSIRISMVATTLDNAVM